MPTEDHDDDVMQMDDVGEETQSTQQNTQETQPTSQQNPNVEEHLWGMLIPCNPALNRVDFQKVKKVYHIGRNTDHGRGGNDIIFPGKKISNFHCKLEWDGNDSNSAVKVTDTSSNGTFINQQKIGKGLCWLLKDGDEIAFGTCMPQTGDASVEDYRFTFRNIATASRDPKGIFSHYQIHGQLGRGSFASVFKALHRSTGQWYAIKSMERKRIRPSDSNQSNSGAQTAFAREIAIMESLSHPRICQLKEVYYEENTINLVLEYVSGGDLLDYILKQDTGRLSEQLSQHFTYQICDALKYIHSKGIAHRDLKPENVLLTTDNPPMVKVADFGLAKAVDSMTMLRTMCGTPAYLAPEIVLQRNREGYDHLVDSWSVGVIVYCMLTGSNPFPDDGEQNLAQRVQTRTIDWYSLRQYVPNDMAEDFIRRLMEYSPRRRMPAFSALEHDWLADLRHLDSGVAPDNVAAIDSEYSQSQLHTPLDDHGNAEADVDVDVDADASMHDMQAHAGSGAMAVEDASMIAEPSEGEDQPPGSQLSGLPGAFPHSQQLQRRADVLLAQSQPSPNEDIIVSDDEGEDRTGGPSVSGNVNDSGNDNGMARKRKALDFEGSLTPMEEDEDEEDDVPTTTPASRMTRSANGARRGAKGTTGAARPSRGTARGGRKTAPHSVPATPAMGVRRSERLGGTPVKSRKV